jgi:hypothetical protein
VSNDNLIQAVSGFDVVDDVSTGHYQAASAGAFNQGNAVDGSFAAFCTFYVRGELVAMPSSLPASGAQFLWGNLSGNNGWSLSLGLADNVLSLIATIGTGAGTVTVAFPLTGSALPSGNFASVIERLIMAALWYDGDNLALTVNGNLVAPSAVVASFGVSNAAVRMGLNPAGSAPAIYADIVSVGFYNGVPLSATTRTIGQLAGLAFRSARESFGSGLILPDSGHDWTYRYWARTLAFTNAPAAANVRKNSIGTSITAPAPANQPLVDIGLGGSQDTAGTAIALLPSTDSGLFLASQKNVDWYHGGGSIAVAPEGPA